MATRCRLPLTMAVVGSTILSGCISARSGPAAASARSQYWAAVDRVSRLQHFTIREVFHWEMPSSYTGHFMVRLVKPGKLVSGYTWPAAYSTSKTDLLSRDELRRIVSGMLLPTYVGVPDLFPLAPYRIFRDVTFDHRSTTTSVGTPGRHVRAELVMISAQGYPWLTYPHGVPLGTPAAAYEDHSRFHGTLTVDAGSGLPLRFVSTVDWLGRRQPGQMVTFSYK